MKIKRLISLLLLAVYLLAAGGPAFASLTCKCVAMKARTVHACCVCCQHESDLPAAKADVSAPCCANHHSTDISLYTGAASDNERLTKCTVYTLPPSLAAESPEYIAPTVRCETLAVPHSTALQERHLLCTGLRAPPVLA